MPTRALVPCRSPMCPELTTSGYCPTHRKAEDKRDRMYRGSAARRGYGSVWHSYSRRYRYEHPYCAMCQQEGKQTIAECVDHIIPVTGPRDPQFWDPKNHQSLCTPCHSRKTVTHDKRGLSNAAMVR